MKTPILTKLQKAQILGDPLSIIPLLEPYRLINLWDMIQFHAREFVLLIEELDRAALIAVGRGNESTNNAENQKYRDLARRLCNECHKHDLKDAAQRANLLYRRLTEDLNKSRSAPAPPRPFSALEEDFREIRHAIVEGLMAILMVIVPRSNAEFYERDNLFELDNFVADDELKADIKAAGNCLALELPTAAVFHLMRIAEHGLRKFARRVEVEIPKGELDFQTWDSILKKIREKLDPPSPAPTTSSAFATTTPPTPLPPLKRKSSRIKRLEAYHSIMQDFRGFEHVWRNPTMHARRSYKPAEATAIFGRVKSFMQELVKVLPRKKSAS